ncbi:nucleoside triphosphate pyrophosphohydrolase [Bacillus sp. T33-2]|uniref:nucleoside triphosphate pyrophosphohydrolase n=1 Tax=Bacillus sp. T33-2 TaxID=2054168 RepID=UPI000C77D2EA|nr:nucleoside triphosphate pyrophosphohydrolase [Bacillus sp. T33-2]PLR95802.1 phosphoribosyl-ATP pyrophosphohydrolase [Bacillus sp. T33-2]
MTIHNKLVRDRIPEIIKGNGKNAKVRQLTNYEYIRELRRKASEELNEYINSKSNEEAGEELADLLEVIHSLAEIHGYSIHDIEQTRKQKAEIRGGFKDRVFLIDVEG